ncbi:DUF1579 domain-containing protein [Roseomonas tokyonensis]|nr:DUF1579 domain-containing protein [Falsiroseomonas tokyonensis]
MDVTPTPEHRWLQRLAGDWTSEAQCVMGSEQPPVTMRGRETVRLLGDVWMIGEGTGEMPDGGTGRTVMTLGYDPEKGHFVGSFIGSMMTMMWLYTGKLDAAGRVLTLEAEGPDMSSPGRVALYHDIIEMLDDDTRSLTSRMQDADGQWQQVMSARYRRVG